MSKWRVSSPSVPTSFAKAKNTLEALTRQSVELNTPNKNGVTKKQTLERGRKQLSKVKTEQQLAEMFKELEPIKAERGTEWLVGVFNELSSARGYGLNGPLAITHQEIKAYCDLMDLDLTPWDVSVIRAMDTAYIDETYKHIAKEQ